MRGVPQEMDCAQLRYHGPHWQLRYFNGAGREQKLPVTESKDATPHEMAAAVEAAIGVDAKLTGTIRIYLGDTLRGTIRLADGEAKEWKSQRQGVAVKAKRADRSDQRNQHERFVRDAIARSLLTLPFANLDRDDPFGAIYGYYKQLLASAESGDPPPTDGLLSLVAAIRQDASVHDSAGNHLKADIERRWCDGLLLHFSWGQDLVTP